MTLHERLRNMGGNLSGGIGRTAVVFGQDTSGAVMTVTATMFVVILGFAGLAVDLGGWYSTKRSMQTAADAAVVTAALEMVSRNRSVAQVTSAAKNAAAANGFDTSNGALVEVTIANDGQSVDVSISQPSPTLFASLFLDGSVGIRATAGASLNGSPICILALEASAARGLLLDSNAEIQADGCSIQVNSTNAAAAELLSNSAVSVTAASICITGDFRDDSSGDFSPTPDTGASVCPPLADPLANVPPPSVGSCDHTRFERDNSLQAVAPGVYCDGLTIKNNSNLEFNPGEYVISGGTLLIDSNSRVFGDGVIFYLTDGATINFESNSTIVFTAPIDGPRAGVLIFQDRNSADGSVHIFNSNSDSRLVGTIYLPNGKFESNSNSTFGIDSAFTILIARTIEINSNARLIVNSDYAASDVPVPLQIAARIARLTR